MLHSYPPKSWQRCKSDNLLPTGPTPRSTTHILRTYPEVLECNEDTKSQRLLTTICSPAFCDYKKKKNLNRIEKRGKEMRSQTMGNVNEHYSPLNIVNKHWSENSMVKPIRGSYCTDLTHVA